MQWMRKSKKMKRIRYACYVFMKWWINRFYFFALFVHLALVVDITSQHITYFFWTVCEGSTSSQGTEAKTCRSRQGPSPSLCTCQASDITHVRNDSHWSVVVLIRLLRKYIFLFLIFDKVGKSGRMLHCSVWSLNITRKSSGIQAWLLSSFLQFVAFCIFMDIMDILSNRLHFLLVYQAEYNDPIMSWMLLCSPNITCELLHW